MSTALRIAPLVFVAAVVQVTVLAGTRLLWAEPDLLLVTIVCVALAAGSVPGAVAGFVGGLLVDVMTLGTLGTTSIVLTLAGYWAGRYGETTGRGRPHAVLVSVLVATVAIAYAGYGLHFLLGEEVSGRRVLFDALLPALLLNLLLVRPVHALCRAALRRAGSADRTAEVRLLG